MSRPLIRTILCALLALAGATQAATFELLPTYDTYVSNDPTEGPTTNHEGGSGMHARDVAGRRRVGYLTYDISEAKTLGAFFTSAGFSNYGHDGGTIHVYGIIESQEDLVTEGLTWNNAPGVQNSPAPALDGAVALDPADLTDILLTFNAPARGVRETTETSEALAEFLSSDTNGFVAFMFAPDTGGAAILRTVELAEEGGTLLTGEVGGQATAAQDPDPEDEAIDVSRETGLSWTPGGFAATHDVYLGTSFDDVNTASRANPMGLLVSEGQVASTYDPGRLELGQTYYWRIDEVNAAPDATIFPGVVWSFTVEPLAYSVAPIIVTSNGQIVGDSTLENTINGSGLNDSDQHSTLPDDMWLAMPTDAEPVWIQYEFDRVLKLHELSVWNYNVLFELALGFGFKDVTIEYSTDGETWTALGDYEFAQATAMADYTPNTTIDLQGIAAKHVRLTAQTGYGMLDQFGLSEVRFLHIPAFARRPQPVLGATDVSPNAVLSWRAGRDAASHEVYLGTDPEALASLGAVAENSITPSVLEFGSMYYWQVDEVNDAEAVTQWQGDLWNFTTQEFALVDGFESYDDDTNRIYDTWLDGWVNETGSTVGHLESPFAEQTVVNSGRQSMPLAYDNSAAPFYAEAERDLGSADWTANGADTLRLFVAGQTPAFYEGADGTILMNGIGTDIWDTADEFRFAYMNLSGDGSIVARVDSLADTDVWAKAGVMIRESLAASSAFAGVYLTGDSGVRYQARLEDRVAAVSDTDVATAEQIALREPVWIKIERAGNAFNGYYSTDGTNWSAMSWNPQTIDMAANVYIGLAVTSHNTAAATGAAFADVTSTGGVSGNWENAEIGVAQPATGNAVESLYVAIEDTTGGVAVVTHPNPAAVALSAWQEWLIPLAEFDGVNLGSVKTMYIGVGDRGNPSAGGDGLIFIDDIGFGRPAPGTE
jgi:regulation of enolase protein 1 (concanavalin A-like superfamily)